MRGGRWTAVVLLALGCGSGGAPGGDPEARLAVLRGQPLAQVRAAIAEEPDRATQDLLRVGLVVADPARYAPLCAEVVDVASRGWCDQVRDRPHLHEGPGEGP